MYVAPFTNSYATVYIPQVNYHGITFDLLSHPKKHLPGIWAYRMWLEPRDLLALSDWYSTTITRFVVMHKILSLNPSVQQQH